MGHLVKFWSLSRREKYFLCEALGLLLLSHLSVKAIPFKQIDRFLRTHWDGTECRSLNTGEDIRLVNLSLSRVEKGLSAKGLCLSRSIASFVMLRRRGIPAVLIAGVKFSHDSALHAHAWIDTGRADLDNAGLVNSSFTEIVRIGKSGES